MQDALTAIKGGRIPPPGSMPSFEEIKEILGFNTYYEEEKRYASRIPLQRGGYNLSILIYCNAVVSAKHNLRALYFGLSIFGNRYCPAVNSMSH